MSDEDLKAELERLKEENEKLKSKKKGTGELSFKVSAKGAMSVYGMGRFPVTLYKEQWERLLERSDDIKSFLDENASKLATKN